MIVLVDYGMGNLRSVAKAIEHLGAPVRVSSSPEDIREASKLILPGVGAFGDAVRELKKALLWEPMKDYLAEGRLFLGICLGQQLLFEASEESPEAEGLGIFPGRVERFRSQKVKIPHMGWNQVKIRNAHPLLRGVPDGSYFYFVHSYSVQCAREDLIAGSCAYGDDDFAAIVGTPSIFATQFHPEKSQHAGLTILKNFVSWT